MSLSRGDATLNHPEFQRLILKSCIDIVRDSLLSGRSASNPPIPKADVDAFSFVISTDSVPPNSIHSCHTLAPVQKQTIKEFLMIFGSQWSTIDIPKRGIASSHKDSIFGSTKNKCQHLNSHQIGTTLVTEESQVISSPVILAVHQSCRQDIVDHICSDHFYVEKAQNKDICFQPGKHSKLPSYGMIVDSILSRSYVSNIDKFVIHIGDIGNRHIIDNDTEEQNFLEILFQKVFEMRSLGIYVETTQLDVAFSIQSVNQLVLWKIKQRERKKFISPTVFEESTVEVWPLHTIATSSSEDNIELGKSTILPDNLQSGTVRLKCPNWVTTQPASSLLRHHYISANGETSPYWGAEDDSPIGNLRIDHNNIYSVKAYSTISHSIQNQVISKVCDHSSMKDIPSKNMRYLQNDLSVLKKTMTQSLKFIQSHGICARLEVSVRPGKNGQGGRIRSQGHLSDFLLHIHVALHDLLILGCHHLKFHTMETELVRDKVHSLIDQTESLLKIRASSLFCDLYSSPRHHDWLRAMFNMIAICVGIAPMYKLRYIRKWIMDSSRYDPTDQSRFFSTEFLMVDKDIEPIQQNGIYYNIPFSNALMSMIHDILSKNGMSDSGSNDVMAYIQSDEHQVRCTECFQRLSLKDKLIFADIGERIIIRQILENDIEERSNQSSEPSKITTLKPSSSLGNYWGLEGEELDSNTLFTQWNQGLDDFGPQSLVESANLLSLGKNLQFKKSRNKQYKQLLSSHPTLRAVTIMQHLLNFADPTHHVYLLRLYHHITMCHHHIDQLQDMNFLPVSSCNESDPLSLSLRKIGYLHSDVDSLTIICNGLNVNTHGSHNKTFLLSKLASHYFFPSYPSHPFLFRIHSLSSNTRVQLNQMLNHTFEQEFVIKVEDQNVRLNHYYRSIDSTHVYTVKKDLLFGSKTISLDLRYESTNIYETIEECFIYPTNGGKTARNKLYLFLEPMISIHTKFFSETAENNINFARANTLHQLQERKHFSLKIDEYPHSTHYRPELIFPITALLFQINIYVIDISNNTSQLHTYEDGQIITYNQVGHPNILFAPRITCQVFALRGQSFQLLNPLRNHHELSTLRVPISTNQSIFRGFQKTFTTVSSHPLGKCSTVRSGSIAQCVVKLLMSQRVKHVHFTVAHPENDPLDILPYIQELMQFHGSASLISIFSKDLISMCQKWLTITIMESTTLQELLAYMRNRHCDEVHYSALLPLLCLKYKLLFIVWEDNKGTKSSHFFGYNPHSKKVESETRNSFVYIEHRSHFLYLRNTISHQNNTTTGWWPGAPLSPFNSPQPVYTYATMLTSAYSYLDGPLKTQIYQKFKLILGMHIVEDEKFTHPMASLGRTKPTLLPLKVCYGDSSIQENCLVVYFPYVVQKRLYPVLVIHGHDVKLVESAVTNIHQCLYPSGAAEYCIQYCLLPSLDFASSFMVTLHMFIAHHSSCIEELIDSLDILKFQLGTLVQTKHWISNVLHSSSYLMNDIPSWISQLLPTKAANEMDSTATSSGREDHQSFQLSPNYSEPDTLVISE